MSKLRINAGYLMLLIQSILTIFLFIRPMKKCQDVNLPLVDRYVSLVKRCDSLEAIPKPVNAATGVINSVLVTYPSRDGVLVKKEYTFATKAFRVLQSDSTIVSGYYKY